VFLGPVKLANLNFSHCKKNPPNLPLQSQITWVLVLNVVTSHKNADMTRICWLDHCHVFIGCWRDKLQGRKPKFVHTVVSILERLTTPGLVADLTRGFNSMEGSLHGVLFESAHSRLSEAELAEIFCDNYCLTECLDDDQVFEWVFCNYLFFYAKQTYCILLTILFYK
jgi:hypothetical protein